MQQNLKYKKKNCSFLCFWVCCFVFVTCTALTSLTLLLKSLISSHNQPATSPPLNDKNKQQLVGCDDLKVSDVWTKNFPKLLTESSIRLLNINNDLDLDIVIGFGTGADGYEVPEVVCDVYFKGTRPCFGGLLALDGRTGDELWRHYSKHEIFAINCGYDLNSDGSEDCVGGGRAGVLVAVNGADGVPLWTVFDDQAVNDIMNFYTPQWIVDVDDDGTVDLVVSHGGDPLADPHSSFRLSGRLLVISGKSGQVLQWVGVPDKKETYYSVQKHVHPDGSEFILFGTGGETHSGSLWSIHINDLLKGNINKAVCVYCNDSKGVMTPAAIVDINGDGVDDIIMSTFNSKVLAFDGLDFKMLWNYTLPTASESYSTPSVGYFNDDAIPDLLIKFQMGPGFPIYYYSETNVVDGKDGAPLLDHPIRDTIGSQSSGLTISMEGYGNDLFLFWTADCKGHEGQSNPFQFEKDTNVHEQSRSDFCFLRFGTEMVSRIYVLGNKIKPPGLKIYDSEERKSLEFSSPVDTEALGRKYLMEHPGLVQQETSRTRRHVGPHDGDGIQRLISTGTLAPLLYPLINQRSIDYVFATYWFFPAKTKAILPEDRDCIQKKMEQEVQRFDPKSKYHGMDHDAYEDSVTHECVEQNRHLSQVNRTYESQTDYNPFAIHMGQMTVYRLRLTCACAVPARDSRCAHVLPFHQQKWASYMGTNADSHAPQP